MNNLIQAQLNFYEYMVTQLEQLVYLQQSFIEMQNESLKQNNSFVSFEGDVFEPNLN